MDSRIVSATTASLLAVLLAGCSTPASKPDDTTLAAAASKMATGPTISEEAQKALTQAEADVDAARARFALWTTAEAALKAAQEAAKAGDSASVISQAAFASGQAQRGLAQLDYPTTEQK